MSLNYSTARPLIRGGGSRDEPMTAAQSARLREVTEQLGKPFDAVLTRRQAAARIRELEKRLR